MKEDEWEGKKALKVNFVEVEAKLLRKDELMVCSPCSLIQRGSHRGQYLKRYYCFSACGVSVYCTFLLERYWKSREDLQGFQQVGRGKTKHGFYSRLVCVCFKYASSVYRSHFQSHIICMSKKGVFFTFSEYFLLSSKSWTQVGLFKQKIRKVNSLANKRHTNVGCVYNTEQQLRNVIIFISLAIIQLFPF